MSACSGMPGPGKVEPSLQRKSTFKPPAGSLFATDGGLLHIDQEGGIMRGAEDNYERSKARHLQMAPVGQPGGVGTPAGKVSVCGISS